MIFLKIFFDLGNIYKFFLKLNNNNMKKIKIFFKDNRMILENKECRRGKIFFKNYIILSVCNRVNFLYCVKLFFV